MVLGIMRYRFWPGRYEIGYILIKIFSKISGDPKGVPEGGLEVDPEGSPEGDPERNPDGDSEGDPERCLEGMQKRVQKGVQT